MDEAPLLVAGGTEKRKHLPLIQAVGQTGWCPAEKHEARKSKLEVVLFYAVARKGCLKHTGDISKTE